MPTFMTNDFDPCLDWRWDISSGALWTETPFLIYPAETTQVSHFSAPLRSFPSLAPALIRVGGERERQLPELSEVTRLQVRLEFLASGLIGVVMYPPIKIIGWLTQGLCVCCHQWKGGELFFSVGSSRLPAEAQRTSLSHCLLSPILLSHHLLPALWLLSWTSPLCTAGSRTAILSATSQTSMSSSQAVTRASGTYWPGSWLIGVCGCWLLASLRRGPRSFNKTPPTGCRPSYWMSPRLRASEQWPSG